MASARYVRMWLLVEAASLKIKILPARSTQYAAYWPGAYMGHINPGCTASVVNGQSEARPGQLANDHPLIIINLLEAQAGTENCSLELSLHT